MGKIKKLKSNELVGGVDRDDVYPITSTKAVFDNSNTSQDDINKDRLERIEDLEETMPTTVKSITINGGHRVNTVDENGNVDLTIYSDGGQDYEGLTEVVADLRDIVGENPEEPQSGTLLERVDTLEGAVGTGGSVDQRIENAINSLDSQIVVDYGDTNPHIRGAVQLADGKLARFEIEEDTSDFDALYDYAHALNETDVIAGPKPSASNAQVNTIYRVPNDPSAGQYTDYMKNGNQMVSLATYDVAGEEAQVGCYVGTISGTALSVTAANNASTSLSAYILKNGGHFKVKVPSAATNTSGGWTLSMKGLAAKQLLYNGESVSSANTWEPEETLSVYYDNTANSGNGAYYATNARGGGGKAEKIKYDNSQSGLSAENVQGALDEMGNCLYSYDIIDWISQTTTLYYYINGSTGKWEEYKTNAKYTCRKLPISQNTKYRLTAGDGNPINYALLNNNSPASHVGEVATDWNNGKPKSLSAGKSVVIDSGEYAFLYVRNNSNSSSTDIKYPKRIERQIALDEITQNLNEDIEDLNTSIEGLNSNIIENEKHILDVESRLYPYLDNIPEVNYAFSVDIFGTITSYQHAAIPVSVGEEYIIEAPSDVDAFYCFATSNVATSGGSIPFIEGVTSATGIRKGNKVKVVIPDTCTYLLVYNVSNTRPFLVKKESLLKKVRVTLGYDYIIASGNTAGDFGQHQQYFESGQYLSTPRFIKISEAFICKFSHAGRLRVIYYDSEFNFVGFKNYPANDSPAIEANTDIFVNEARFKYSYVKLLFDTETPFNNGKPLEVEAEVRGNLDDNWDVFNIRTATYHRICVMVNVSDARCSDGITSQIQDSIDLRPNYGVIALPKIYSNTGKPTRLIIYCHGAGTHFTFSNATGFNTREHVNPNYWLKEGYAVMDIDGNPMATKSAHAFRPQAMSAYIAAYKWAIEHYNLCRDGALLGGRSMGAGTVMYLLRGTCPIPVIAACANHPTSVAMGETTSSKSVNAELRGFTIPEGFTFSDGPMNDADTQVFYDNWNKSLRYVPSLALCVDTPTTEEWRKNFIKNCCHAGEPYESNRIAACKDLHMIIRAPLKMFGCFEDPNNGYQATAQLYMTMLGNAGQQAEYRLYHSDKPTNYPDSIDSRTEHYYELADPTLRTTFTTVYGEEVTDVPVVYIEMLQFWRRYEQNM